MKVPESDAMPSSKVTSPRHRARLLNNANIGDCPVDDYKLYARLFQFHKALGKPATGGGQMNAMPWPSRQGSQCTLVLGTGSEK
jgi:hypothetical protein